MMLCDRDNNTFVEGVTLVELVVAMSMMTVVLTAVLPLFAGIRNSWDTRRANTEIVQNARVLVDHLQRHLTQAVQIADVSSSSEEGGYIEFTANDGVDYRYSVSGDGYVQFGASAEDPADLAGPVNQFQFVCYDGNDFATPTDDPNAICFVSVDVTFYDSVASDKEKAFTTNVYLRAVTASDQEESQVVPGVAIGNSVTWSGQGMTIDSYRSSQGTYDSANPGTNAVVAVNATGYGSITLSGQASIYGDAYIGPGGDPDLGIQTSGGSEITGVRGTLTGEVDMVAETAPAGSPFDEHHDGNFSLWGTSTATIDSDRYFNKVNLGGTSRLVIDGHVTLLLNNAFQMSSGAEIYIEPDSSLTMYVKHSVGLWGSTLLNDSTKDPSRLHIYMIGNSKDFEMTSDATMYGVVENPRGGVSIWTNAQLFGKLKAETLEGGGRIHVDLDCNLGSGTD